MIGWKVLAHNPMTYAEVSGKGFAINSNAEAFIGVSSQYTESTDPLKNLPLHKRQCLISDEDLCKDKDLSSKINKDINIYQYF